MPATKRLKIVSPSDKSIVRGEFNLRLAIQKVEEGDKLALYINRDKFATSDPASRLRLRNLPIETGKKFKFTVAIVNSGTIVDHQTIEMKYYPADSTDHHTHTHKDEDREENTQVPDLDEWQSKNNYHSKSLKGGEESQDEDEDEETDEDSGEHHGHHGHGEVKKSDKQFSNDDEDDDDTKELVAYWASDANDTNYTLGFESTPLLKAKKSPKGDKKGKKSAGLIVTASTSIPVGTSHVVVSNETGSDVTLTLPTLEKSAQTDNVVAVRQKIVVLNLSRYSAFIVTPDGSKINMTGANTNDKCVVVAGGEAKIVLMGNAWYGHGFSKSTKGM